MRQKAVVMLVLACAMGGTAVYLARGWLERQPQAPVLMSEAPKPERAKPTVVVAKRQLNFGDELSNETLRVVEWPDEAAPEGSFASIDQIVAGGERRVALRDIDANELVLRSRVSGFGGRATLSGMLAPEMRAVTIRVNDVQGVAGFVLPGDHVDVLFTRAEGAGDTDRTRSAPIIDVLLQNLKVLAVDQFADSQKDKPVVAKAVTLEVNTEQAQKLTLASEVGSLSLALRNFGNAQMASATTITVGGLIGNPIPVTVAEAAPASTYNVRIVRGTDESLQVVEPERRPRSAAPAKPVPRSTDRIAMADRHYVPAEKTAP